MEQRRRFTRWQIDKLAKIKLEGAEAFADCKVKDISLKGLMLYLALKLPQDVFLRLGVVLSEDAILDVEAWVVWHKAIDGYNAYGVYFSKIKDVDKEKIYQFIRRYFPNQLAQQWWQDTQKGGEIMANNKFEDRRVFERFPVRFPVRFLDPTANQEGLAYTQDISAKGMGLEMKEELPIHTSLEMWLEIPDKGEPVYTRGEVVWAKRIGVNEYRAGINLQRADLMGLSRVLRA